jgi:DNA-binding phage protein
MMSTYTLKSGDIDTVVSADDRRAAFKHFFARVVEDDLVDDIGHVVRLHDGDEKYPMRTVPALYAAGVIERERAVTNVAEATQTDRAEADRLLQDATETDAWVVGSIQESGQ